MQAPVAQKDYSLDDLLAGITTSNRHAEANWGPPQGQERWLAADSANVEYNLINYNYWARSNRI